MKRVLFFIFFNFYLTESFSQKQDYIWLGGYRQKEDGKAIGFRFNFLKNQEQFLDTTKLGLGIIGDNASLCDKDGNLLFYTNGCAVFNKNHEMMPNGDSINAGEWFDIFWQGDCQYGYPGAQDVMILNDPKNDDGYYLLHKPNIYYPIIDDSVAMYYSYIDLSLNNQLGDVTKKNIKYYSKENSLRFYLTAIIHPNKKDWWIIQPTVNDSLFLTFLINENGINNMPDQNTHQFFNKHRSTASGMSQFSPDGTKYALYNYYDQLHVYNFDRATGILSNHIKVEIYHPDSIDISNINFSSVEWSPNSRFIYCASEEKLHQVDTWESNIQNGVKLIGEYDGSQNPFPSLISFMAQAPDCRIYITPKSGSYTLHTINKPDELGTACDFVQNSIRLPYPNGGSFPNFPRFRVDEEEKCDPTITSVFGEDVYYRRKLEVYPNPSYGNYIIKLPQEINKGHLVVSNINGQVILKQEIQNQTYIKEIDITSFPSGRYNIDVYPEDNHERIFYGVQVIKI